MKKERNLLFNFTGRFTITYYTNAANAQSGMSAIQLSTTIGGWDGTYNNHLLPADDYWLKWNIRPG